MHIFVFKKDIYLALEEDKKNASFFKSLLRNHEKYNMGHLDDFWMLTLA